MAEATIPRLTVGIIRAVPVVLTKEDTIETPVLAISTVGTNKSAVAGFFQGSKTERSQLLISVHNEAL
jgi:hypothetical protein